MEGLLWGVYGGMGAVHAKKIVNNKRVHTVCAGALYGGSVVWWFMLMMHACKEDRKGEGKGVCALARTHTRS